MLGTLKGRDSTPVGAEVAEVTTNHRLFARLLAHALACDQTRVFNVMATDGLSQLRFAGEANTHHLFTHEDPIDEKLGYQPNVAKFFPTILGMFGSLLAEMDSIREGDKTLLDRMLIFNYTDSGYAKNHTTDNIPMPSPAGGAGRPDEDRSSLCRRKGRLGDAPFADEIQQAFGVSDLELRHRIEQHLEDHHRGDGVTVAHAISMKSGATPWVGAAGVALLAAIGVHWLPHREKAWRMQLLPAPLATPFWNHSATAHGRRAGRGARPIRAGLCGRKRHDPLFLRWG